MVSGQTNWHPQDTVGCDMVALLLSGTYYSPKYFDPTQCHLTSLLQCMPCFFFEWEKNLLHCSTLDIVTSLSIVQLLHFLDSLEVHHILLFPFV